MKPLAPPRRGLRSRALWVSSRTHTSFNVVGLLSDRNRATSPELRLQAGLPIRSDALPSGTPFVGSQRLGLFFISVSRMSNRLAPASLQLLCLDSRDLQPPGEDPTRRQDC